MGADSATKNIYICICTWGQGEGILGHFFFRGAEMCFGILLFLFHSFSIWWMEVLLVLWFRLGGTIPLL
jgi:hypothetical protein